jgi:hypothetical protein
VQVACATAAGDRLVQHRPSLHFLHVLAEIADGHALGNRYVAFVGLFFADDHAEKRGLPGSVGADQANLLAGIQLKRRFYENELLAVLFIDV